MKLTLIIALCSAAVVFGLSIYFCKKNPFGAKTTYDIPMNKRNWLITLGLTAATFIIVLLIGWGGA